MMMKMVEKAKVKRKATKKIVSRLFNFFFCFLYSFIMSFHLLAKELHFHILSSSYFIMYFLMRKDKSKKEVSNLANDGNERNFIELSSSRD